MTDIPVPTSQHPSASAEAAGTEPRDRVDPGPDGGLSPGAPVLQAVQTYAAAYPMLRQVTDDLVIQVTSLLDDAGINYLNVTGRAKTVASFAAKAVRETDGGLVYDDPLTQITDQIGLRVVTYLSDDVDAVADLLSEQGTILDDRDMGQETADEGHWGYASRHLLVVLNPTPEGDDGGRGPDHHRASVQVRTVLQHAWAEFEHDIRYKGTIPPEQLPDLNRRFTLAAGLLELADREFTAIRDRIQATMTTHTRESTTQTSRIGATQLTQFLAARYAEAGWSRTDHYTWISGLLHELNIGSLTDLDALLGSVDDEAIHQRMGYRQPSRAVRRLDDALLAVFGERYIELEGNKHRTSRLTARRERLWAPPAAGPGHTER